jgi:hypothetical protein
VLHRGASGLDPTSTQPARRVVGRRRGGRRLSGGLRRRGRWGGWGWGGGGLRVSGVSSGKAGRVRVPPCGRVWATAHWSLERDVVVALCGLWHGWHGRFAAALCWFMVWACRRRVCSQGVRHTSQSRTRRVRIYRKKASLKICFFVALMNSFVCKSSTAQRPERRPERGRAPQHTTVCGSLNPTQCK